MPNPAAAQAGAQPPVSSHVAPHVALGGVPLPRSRPVDAPAPAAAPDTSTNDTIPFDRDTAH
jgi:hypothetical protein